MRASSSLASCLSYLAVDGHRGRDTESGEREGRIAAGGARRGSMSPKLPLPGKVDSSRSDSQE